MLQKILNHNLFKFVFFILLGLFLSVLFQKQGINLSEIDYTYLTYSLLAIGLYGGVYAIDLKEFRIHKKIIISAITIGVILKSLIIGGLLFFFTQNILSFLFGIIVAQIDPISVSHLLQKNKTKKLSKSGETILRAWSSFDDPMTVLLSIYLALPLLGTYIKGKDLSFDFTSYFSELFYNLLFAAFIFILFKIFQKKFSQKKILEILLLVIIFCFVIYFKLMLSIALIALFFRPKISKTLDKAINFSLYISTILLGILLINGISFFIGFLLAIFTVLSQIIALFILMREFSQKDKVYLAFGQQNGITSIILAIIIESFYSGTISIIAPAIFFINSLYFILNHLADKYFKAKVLK